MAVHEATRDKIKERRLERMRLGQAVCEMVPLISDPEIRFALVPLNEAEYTQVLVIIAGMSGIDDLANATLKDRRQSQEILVRSIREPSDLTQRVYDDVEEMMEDIDVTDVDELIDRYNEMIHNSSPAAEGIPAEEWDELKKVFVEIPLSELSGRAWYALKRFLGEITPQLQAASLSGHSSTSNSTTKTD